jgi:hypothetical protein
MNFSVATNDNRTKLQSPQGGENQYSNNPLALVPKGPSSPGYFNANYTRSPLGSLTENNDAGFGLRQRRGGASNDVYDKHSTSLMSTTTTAMPPRASLTMSMGPQSSSSMESTSTISNEVSFQRSLFDMFFTGMFYDFLVSAYVFLFASTK